MLAEAVRALVNVLLNVMLSILVITAQFTLVSRPSFLSGPDYFLQKIKSTSFRVKGEEFQSTCIDILFVNYWQVICENCT